MTQKKSRFDWYATRQRFFIRKYHIGAASVLLGTALVLGTAATVSADETTAAIVTTAEGTETPDADQAPAVDKTALSQALEAAKAIDLANKPADLAESFVEVFTQTTDLLNKADATQEEVDAALVKLNTAVEAIKAAAVEAAPEVLASAVETPEADELAPVEEVTEAAATEEEAEVNAADASRYVNMRYLYNNVFLASFDNGDSVAYAAKFNSTRADFEAAGISIINSALTDSAGPVRTVFGEFPFVTRPDEFKPKDSFYRDSKYGRNPLTSNKTYWKPDNDSNANHLTKLAAGQVFTYTTIYVETAKIEITDTVNEP